MSLFQRTKSKRTKRSKASKQKVQRVRESAHPTSQSSIMYASQYEDGLMHIVGNEYSKMYQLGDFEYEITPEEEQVTLVSAYAKGLNTLGKQSRYQLLVHNRRIKSDILDDVELSYQGDGYDDLRQEINTIIGKTHNRDAKNFKVDKYAIFTTTAKDKAIALKNLNKTSKNYIDRFAANDISMPFNELDGLERLKVMSRVMNPNAAFTTTYRDIAVSGLTSKAFIAPSSFRFPKNQSYFKVGERFSQVLYIRQYPQYLEDQLIKELCDTGIELTISIHANPYDMKEARDDIRDKQTLNQIEVDEIKSSEFQKGRPGDNIKGQAVEVTVSAEALLSDFKNSHQRLFSGIFCVYVSAESQEKLEEYIAEIKEVGDTHYVVFEGIDFYKEEALNSVLPLGKPYVDVEMNYMRDMTTNNIVTQVPWMNLEIQSRTGMFYGQNQLTKNMISIDREDAEVFITPSGMYLGSSGSGKGMTVKWEMINIILKKLRDRLIIVDPESEYLWIAKLFKAEILDISTGTNHHLNILDLTDRSKLDEKDQNLDLIKEKANLLSSLFESLLQEYNDSEAGLVDRVTRLTYKQFETESRNPTLVDWFEILKEQPEQIAKEFVPKVEPYTIGSQDIFAHETNIDLSSRFILFNVKNLDERMKPFAMKVILDQIWKQVVEHQHLNRTHLYFDELQLNFDTEDNALWFSNLWSRVRKYGAITNGITQNISLLLESAAGRRMISNTEFIVLLRQKANDLRYLKEILNLTPKLLNYVGDRVERGSGLIYAGGIILPFKNRIPKDTKLYEIMNTDA